MLSLGAPVIAIFAARLNCRSLLLAFMIFFSLAHLGTMLAPDYYSIMLFRFLNGLPHDAYFGVGALVAAAMVPPAKRTQAVGLMMVGLTIAITIGVPLSSWLARCFSACCYPRGINHYFSSPVSTIRQHARWCQ